MKLISLCFIALVGLSGCSFQKDLSKQYAFEDPSAVDYALIDYYSKAEAPTIDSGLYTSQVNRKNGLATDRLDYELLIDNATNTASKQMHVKRTLFFIPYSKADLRWHTSFKKHGAVLNFSALDKVGRLSANNMAYETIDENSFYLLMPCYGNADYNLECKGNVMRLKFNKNA